MDALEMWVRGGLERRGLEVEELDVDIIRFADSVYGPAIQRLLDADLSGIAPEHDLDLSRAPSST